MREEAPRRSKPFDRLAFVSQLSRRRKGVFREEFFSALKKGDSHGPLFVRRFLWEAVRGLIRATIRRSRGSASVAAGALWAGSVLFEEHWLKPEDQDSGEQLSGKLKLAQWLLAETARANELEDQDDRMLMSDIHLASIRLVSLLRSRLGDTAPFTHSAIPPQLVKDPYGGRTLFSLAAQKDPPAAEA